MARDEAAYANGERGISQFYCLRDLIARARNKTPSQVDSSQVDIFIAGGFTVLTRPHLDAR